MCAVKRFFLGSNAFLITTAIRTYGPGVIARDVIAITTIRSWIKQWIKRGETMGTELNPDLVEAAAKAIARAAATESHGCWCDVCSTLAAVTVLAAVTPMIEQAQLARIAAERQATRIAKVRNKHKPRQRRGKIVCDWDFGPWPCQEIKRVWRLEVTP
jgi:hypothetical protein